MDIEPAEQLWLPGVGRGELFIPGSDTVCPVEDGQVMRRVLRRSNLKAALRRVERNSGQPGADGMKAGDLREYLKIHWPDIRSRLLAGEYQPTPVKRVWIPKPGGGKRPLGIPTVLDRFIQQAVLQVLQADWDPTFSEASYGFRPGRSAHQAVYRAREFFREGYGWVVDLDLEKFFDRVNHDRLMHEVGKRVSDRKVLALIRCFLRSGTLEQEVLCRTEEGTPQGGPLSPLLANLLLDVLDRELERRGHRFVRYADDCNIFVKSRAAGRRVLKSISRFLTTRLRLSVNQAKSAVGRPWNRSFLGFTISTRENIRISRDAIRRLKSRVREITRRTRGRRIEVIVNELHRYMTGWRAYYRITEVRSVLRELDSWIKRRLRCYIWKQWGRRGYRELVRRGVSRGLAWNTSKSAHGPWRLSRSPALAFALKTGYFDYLGLPKLYVNPT